MRDLYQNIQEPISIKILQSYNGIPTRKVFQRVFGSWKTACEEAGVPYNQKTPKVGELRTNRYGYLLKIVNYNTSSDILVEFQDEYKSIVHTDYKSFVEGSVRNPYIPNVLGIGVIGENFNSNSKEYKTWYSMLSRSFDKKYKNKALSYENVTCCKEWLLYENFYKWIHSQENYEIWIQDDESEIDKDILFKGNKIYSPITCSLVPRIVNNLFINRARCRGEYPVGVTRHGNRFRARCDNPILGTRKHIGIYDTPEDAFYAYKEYKESVIKEVANIEYTKGAITRRCYEAMLNYKIEITD